MEDRGGKKNFKEADEKDQGDSEKNRKYVLTFGFYFIFKERQLGGVNITVDTSGIMSIYEDLRGVLFL